MVRNKARESNNMISAEKSAGRGFNSHSRLQRHSVHFITSHNDSSANSSWNRESPASICWQVRHRSHVRVVEKYQSRRPHLNISLPLESSRGPFDNRVA